MDWKFKLPDQFKELEALVNKSAKRINEIDIEINRLGIDKGPQGKLNPPTINGAVGKFGPNLKSEQLKAKLLAEKSALQLDVIQDVKKVTMGTDPKTRKSVIEDVERVIVPSAYDGLDQIDREAERQEKKPVDQSQDMARTLIHDYRDLHREEIEENILDRYSEKFSKMLTPKPETTHEDISPENVVDKHTENFLNKLGKYKDAIDFANNKKDILKDIEPKP